MEIKRGIKNSMKKGYLGYLAKIRGFKIVHMYWEGGQQKDFRFFFFNI
jgi:hypothetical protein